VTDSWRPKKEAKESHATFVESLKSNAELAAIGAAGQGGSRVRGPSSPYVAGVVKTVR